MVCPSAGRQGHKGEEEEARGAGQDGGVWRAGGGCKNREVSTWARAAHAPPGGPIRHLLPPCPRGAPVTMKNWSRMACRLRSLRRRAVTGGFQPVVMVREYTVFCGGRCVWGGGCCCRGCGCCCWSRRCWHAHARRLHASRAPPCPLQRTVASSLTLLSAWRCWIWRMMSASSAATLWASLTSPCSCL